MNKTILIVAFTIFFVSKVDAQKGETSLAAGVLVAFPQSDPYTLYTSWSTGLGVEAIGQYNFTNKSSALLQLQVIHFAGTTSYAFSEHEPRFTSVALKGGYRIDISPYGFYANALIGFEFNKMFTPATLGIGKRFQVGRNFIDLGGEATGGVIPHYNIRAVYSLLRKTRENQKGI